jgi:DNA-directed RNA polymerase subunit L
MRITKVTYGEKTLEMQIEEEDIALADIIHHELLNDSRVVFAGAISTHPLLKTMKLRVETKGTEPIDAIIDSCRKAAKNATELLDKTNKSLGNGDKTGR